MAHNPWERDGMSALVEASSLVRSLADPASAGYCVKAAINSAANKLRKFNWTHNRVRDVWYARSKVALTADELKQLRWAAKLKQEDQEATDEFREIRERLEKIERLLLAQGAEPGGKDLASIRSSVDRLGRVDGRNR